LANSQDSGRSSMKSISKWSGSQKLTAVVAVLYAGSAIYHAKGGRPGLALLTASWVVGNAALVSMEGV
jgi:hypothetical protein